MANESTSTALFAFIGSVWTRVTEWLLNKSPRIATPPSVLLGECQPSKVCHRGLGENRNSSTVVITHREVVNDDATTVALLCQCFSISGPHANYRSKVVLHYKLIKRVVSYVSAEHLLMPGRPNLYTWLNLRTRIIVFQHASIARPPPMHATYSHLCFPFPVIAPLKLLVLSFRWRTLQTRSLQKPRMNAHNDIRAMREFLVCNAFREGRKMGHNGRGLNEGMQHVELHLQESWISDTA